MPMSDYETKVEQQTASGKVDRFSVRFSITPAEPEEVAGVTDSFTSKIHLQMSDSSDGKLITISDLKARVRLNNVVSSGDLDFSNGELDYDVTDLKVGRNRISAEIVGFGVSVITVLAITRKVIALRSILPTKTDSYATGVGTIWTQVTPEKAGVAVTYTRDDSTWTQTEITDTRGVAKCDGIVVKKPTHFTIICPVANIGQGPERLCIIPAPVGIPAWTSRLFKICTIGFGIIIALLVFAAFVSSEVQQVPTDPVIARSLRAKNSYAVAIPETISAAKYSVVWLRKILWICFSVGLLGMVLTTTASMWNAMRAGFRNWRYRSSENRMGQTPTAQTNGTAATTSTASQSATKVGAVSSAVYKQLWEIGREIIAEAFVDAAARGVRSFKIM